MKKGGAFNYDGENKVRGRTGNSTDVSPTDNMLGLLFQVRVRGEDLSQPLSKMKGTR